MTKRMKWTTSPMNTGAFKRVFSVLVVLLLAATLMVGTGSAAEGDSASTPEASTTPVVVYTYADLTANLSNNVPSIQLGADIYATAEIGVTYAVTIDGLNHKIIAVLDSANNWSQDNSYKHLLNIETVSSGSVVLKNITFENNASNAYLGKNKWGGDQLFGAHGISAYRTGDTSIQLDNVVIKDSAGSGLHLNGANGILKNVVIQDSYWDQSIDLDKGSGETASTLTIDDLKGLKDLTQISDESQQATVTVGEVSAPANYIWYSGDKATRNVWASAESYPTEANGGIFVALVEGGEDSVPSLYTDLANATSASGAKKVTLMKGITLSSAITIPEGVTLEGNGQTITLDVEEGYATTIITVGKNAIVQNVNIVAGEGQTFGKAITLGESSKLDRVNLDLSKVTATHKDAQESDPPDVNRLTSFAVSFGTKGASVENSTIIAGNSQRSSSQAITIPSGADDNAEYTIKNNTITLGKAATESHNKNGKSSSGSQAVRIAADTVKVTIEDNEIIGTQTSTPRDVAIAIDGGNVDGVTVTAKGNTITLSDKKDGAYGAVVYVDDGQAATGITVNLNNNEIVSSTYFIYADDAEVAASASVPISVSVNGNVYNNWINVKQAVANHTNITLTDSIVWNTNPAPLGDNKNWNGDQTSVAGNWWVGYSDIQIGTASGYKTFKDAAAAKAAGVPVGDLYPLVTVDTEAANTIVIAGNTSINGDATGATDIVHNMTAKFSDGTTTAFEWSWDSTASSILTFCSDEAGTTSISGTSYSGSVIYYKVASGTAKGSATLHVKNGDVEGDIIITVVKTTQPADVSVTVTETTEGVTIAASGMTDAAGTALASGAKIETAYIPAGDGVKIQLTYESGATVGSTGDTISGPQPEVTFIYEEAESSVLITFPYTVSSAVNVSMTSETVLAAGGVNNLAGASQTEGFVESVAEKVLDTGIYVPIAMKTAGDPTGSTLATFNANITENGVKITFIIDGVVTEDLIILHVGNNVDKLETTVDTKSVSGKTIVTATSNHKFSSYVLAYDNTPADNGGGSPSSGSPSSGSSTWLEPTQQPTQTPTEQPTTPTDTVPTDMPSTQPTATPSTPGFGVLAVLAGLGAVAVLRRQ